MAHHEFLPSIHTDSELLAAVEAFLTADRAVTRLYAEAAPADPAEHLQKVCLFFWADCRRQVEAIEPRTFVGRLARDAVEASVTAMFGDTESDHPNCAKPPR